MSSQPAILRFASLVLLCALALPGALAAQELELKRVLLSTGGVGYFEYEAEVEGDVSLPLEVRLDQVNDVLKSIVVYDDTGAIGQISLPGKQPLQEVFRELPFKQSDLTSPVALLNALRGAQVRTQGASSAEGRLLAVVPEQVRLPDNQGSLVRHRVSLLTATGVRQLILEDVESLRFVDAGLQAQVDSALEAVAENAKAERRRLTVTLSGAGKRTVRVAYVVGAPLWKAAYRLTLPTPGTDAEGGKGALQGWAVLENLSGEDWNNVELTVVSGNPVTLRQALYDAYFVDRPEVPVEVLGRIMPKMDEGAAPEAEMVAAAPRPTSPSRARARVGTMAMADRASGLSMSKGYQSKQAPSVQAMVSGGGTPEAANMVAAESQEATTQVVFRMPRPITVAAGHSLMVPIVNRAVPAEALVLYQPSTHPRHPLAAAELNNDGQTGLPPGVLTLYERGASGMVSFVGDARMAALPAGEERLVSFALDQKTTVDRETKSDSTITQAKIANGVMELTQMMRATTVYTVKGPARESRKVLLEHPRRQGWTLVTPDQDGLKKTASAYRLSLTLEPGETKSLTVTMQRPQTQRVRLATLSPSQADFYIGSQELDQKQREAIERIRELAKKVVEAEQALQRLTTQRQRIIDAQSRVRENLSAVPREGDLYRRFLDKLSAQETELEDIETQRAEWEGERDAARKVLGDYTSQLRL